MFINKRAVDDPSTRAFDDQGTRVVDDPSIRGVDDPITREVDDPSTRAVDDRLAVDDLGGGGGKKGRQLALRSSLENDRLSVVSIT